MFTRNRPDKLPPNQAFSATAALSFGLVAGNITTASLKRTADASTVVASTATTSASRLHVRSKIAIKFA